MNETKNYNITRSHTDDVKLAEIISLIGELSKKISDRTSVYYPENDVPKGMKLVLQCLANKNGVTQLDIVKFTGFKPPTISIMLQKMEALGLVMRKPDEYDLRAMRVFITEEGKKVYTNSVRVVKAIEGIVLRGLSEDEIASTVKVLNKIKENLE